ncbi:MAG: DUF1003 domain-containing protein [Sphingomonas sp.]
MVTQRSAGPILPAHIEQTVHAIAELHAEHQRTASAIQRLVERSVRFIGRPRFVGLLTAFVFLWILANSGLSHLGAAFDTPGFQILQDLGELLGLFITILILITQRRENELVEHREQLTLELAILSEQKSAKIIQLLEEIRRDNPLLRDRDDSEARALSVAADPQAVFDAIKERRDELMKETDAEGLRDSKPKGGE